MKDSAVHGMHLSIAEAGKVHALKHNHKEALRHYKEAMRLAVSSKAPEVFFRHYTQCVLESLELTGGYDEVIQFCRDADTHYESLNLNTPLHRRDHGSILERLGMVLLKKGEPEEGRLALEQAQKIAGKGVLPATDEVLGWFQRGFSVDETRLLQSQRRHNYFVVRAGKVDKERARSLEESINIPDQASIFNG